MGTFLWLTPLYAFPRATRLEQCQQPASYLLKLSGRCHSNTWGCRPAETTGAIPALGLLEFPSRCLQAELSQDSGDKFGHNSNHRGCCNLISETGGTGITRHEAPGSGDGQGEWEKSLGDSLLFDFNFAKNPFFFPSYPPYLPVAVFHDRCSLALVLPSCRDGKAGTNNQASSHPCGSLCPGL